MKRTRTGGYPIGFRMDRDSPWQQDLAVVVQWALENGFRALELLKGSREAVGIVREAGLRVGAIDLPEMRGMISPDAKIRQAAVQQNAELIEQCATFGPLNYFVMMSPDQRDLPRDENFAHMVEGYAALLPTLETHDARLVVEGFPGRANLVCTPETFRALLAQCRSSAICVNYDPSHLVRMGIDPLRFLREFIAHIGHVHAKDTAICPERLYAFGQELPPTFEPQPLFGRNHWRYTIPGHGRTPWIEVFETLDAHGYAGTVSIEMEDRRFHGSEELEKSGLMQSAVYLEGC